MEEKITEMTIAVAHKETGIMKEGLGFSGRMIKEGWTVFFF
jgi:hypothetical protein